MTDKIILRGDYKPYSHDIPRVELDFELDAARTRVTATLHVERKPSAKTADLVLDADGLAFEKLLVDGRDPGPSGYTLTDTSLTVHKLSAKAVVTVVNTFSPEGNKALSGIYLTRTGNRRDGAKTNLAFMSQCEAEGFRRITYWPDRPDVMSCFTVTIHADRAACPVLLSNGNLEAKGTEEGNRHWARWVDPFRKPCYLFALVAGDLVSRDETIVKGDGTEALLQIWTEPQNYDKGAFALESLKKAIAWDRGRFGLDLDLSRFSIVATDDFNFGAMENKGLNIFNSRCVMASPASATDRDYALVESVIAHEYCHNWTGDRVTLRDWFQLTLKEGLTVFRDQEFTMDTAPDDSARAVKRIEDARYMRRVQYLEDAGPMAHPIRPDSYREINNFYTATVYDKGAEVVRMLQTIIGREAFGKALSHYIAKFDGRAVTCDDFLGAVEESCGRDLKQFSRWWSQAGTPRVSVRTSYNQINWTYTVTASQATAPTPGQPDKEPLLIPIAVALIDQSSMQNLPLGMAGSDDKPLERVLELSRGTQSWVFTGIPKPPALSLGRGFSAPVIFEYERSDEELGFLARHDTDPFNRAEAMQELSLRMLDRLCDAIETGQPPEVSAAWQTAFAAMLADEAVAPSLKALALQLPSEAEVGQRRAMIDPASIRAAVQKARETIGRKLAHELAACAAANVTEGPYSPDAGSAGKRALKNLALDYWLASNEVKAVLAVRRQFDAADNLTDQLAALSMCANGRSPAKTKLLSDAINKWYPDPLLVNKWFRVQATAVCHPGEKPVVDRIRELMGYANVFSLANPNNCYALLVAFFTDNPAEFHRPDGSGYAFWKEQLLAVDRINPHVSARIARALDHWRRYSPELARQMHGALLEVSAEEGLSRAVREIIDRSLNMN